MLTENYVRFYTKDSDGYIITNCDCHEDQPVGDALYAGIEVEVKSFTDFTKSSDDLEVFLETCNCEVPPQELTAALTGQESAWKVSTVAVDDDGVSFWLENGMRTEILVLRQGDYAIDLKIAVVRETGAVDRYAVHMDESLVSVEEFDSAFAERDQKARRTLEFRTFADLVPGLGCEVFMARITEHR